MNKDFHDFLQKHQVNGPPSYSITYAGDAIVELLDKLKQAHLDGFVNTITKPKYQPGTSYAKKVAENLELDQSVIDGWFGDPRYDYFLKHSVAEIAYKEPIYGIVGDALDRAIAEKFNMNPENMLTQMHILKPGYYFPWHYDQVRKGYVSESGKDQVKYMIFFDDWVPGQIVQMGDDFIKWKRGDALTFDVRNTPHGSCNFGHTDRYALHIMGATI